jgi:peptidyl-prolyl cis-trans isomerase C
MRKVPRTIATSSILSAIAFTSTAGSIESDPIVVTVGTRGIPLSLLSKRLESLADFQRQALGSLPTMQAKNYIQTVLIPELLMAEHGRKTLDSVTPRRHATEAALLRQAYIANLKQSVMSEAPIAEVDVRKFYDTHPELFTAKEQIRLQRILVGSESEAKELIEKIKSLTSMDDFRNLAREKSLDKATAHRGGELGFVAEDGSTDVPELNVDKALFTAAKSLKDGQVVPSPVAEGKYFAVVWRRGSRAQKTASFESEYARIRQHLLEERVEARLSESLVSLSKNSLTFRRPELLETIDFKPILERGFSIQPSPASALSAAQASSKP